MKFVKANSPFIRRDDSVLKMMMDCLIALMPLTIFSIVVNGLEALRVVLLSVSVMAVLEALFVLIRKRSNKELKYDVTNLITPTISGIIYALLLPAGASSYIVIVGAAFGIVFAKLVFGGTGSNIFNVAGAGRVFVSICFPLSEIALYSTSNYFDVVAGATPLTNLKGNFTGEYAYSIKNLFLGFAPGSIGEVSKLFILIGAIYLIIRHAADWRIIVTSVVSFFVLALFAGLMYKLKRDTNFNYFTFGVYELLSGGMLFGSVFMLTDPVTAPVSRMGKITYALIVSIITIFIRLFGAYSEGCVFAILIANMFSSALDYYKFNRPRKKLTKLILPASILIFALVVIIFAM